MIKKSIEELIRDEIEIQENIIAEYERIQENEKDKFSYSTGFNEGTLVVRRSIVERLKEIIGDSND